MTVTDSDVRDALRTATDHLDSPPALLDDVRRCGRRRLVQRRTLLGTGLAVGVAAATAGVVTWRATGGPMEIASPLLDNPTRGDLAGDRTFLDRVRRAWRRSVSEADVPLAGEAHVVWAGGTPAGPAAFVVQRTADNPIVSHPDGHRLFAMCSFVHTTADGLRTMIITQVDDGPTDGVPQAALLGAGYDTLLVIDFGDPVSYSTDLAIGGFRVTRTWRPARFHDGAFVVRVGSQRDRIAVAVGREPFGSLDRVHLANDTEILDGVRAGRPEPTVVSRALPGAERAWGADPLGRLRQAEKQVEAALADHLDPCGTHLAGTDPLYSIVGATPDGRRLWMRTLQWDDYPSRHLAFLAPPDGPFTLAEGITVRPGSGPFPALLPLPDGQGTLLARAGARLRHRAAGGAWQDGGVDAVLAPPDAVEVEISAPGRAPEVVTLPR